MIQKGYNGLPKPRKFPVVYRKRDGERELLKDRRQMAVFSLITAVGTLLGYSMEQRGPTVSSCRGSLIYHPHTRSALHFQLLLLGPPKKQAEVATHIQCLACSAHSGHHPSSLCSPQSPAASVEDVGWPERGSEVAWWERHTAPRLPPETPHAVTVKAHSSFPEAGQPLEAACSTHTVCLLEERHHAPFKENSSKILKLLLLGLNLNNPYK